MTPNRNLQESFKASQQGSLSIEAPQTLSDQMRNSLSERKERNRRKRMMDEFYKSQMTEMLRR